MYGKQEASLMRKEFWTSLGLYMRPLLGAEGEPVNWLNYKTGVKHIYFRMDADNKKASIGIELRQVDESVRKDYFARLVQMRGMLEEEAGEGWVWEEDRLDEDGRVFSRIGISIDGVNIFNKADWPAMISFLKPRMLALDNFWWQVKDILL
ncbi:DUF4268 domain-containing protein [Terrimonas sp. NA20]|uniref:DUF4268 domain-containing protein n=1 Tax=Terrimonas ginsenosidimutans TaxID=2908004 RepID=A0ABS9KLI0_9BACT|nr:DUF4268 domain-containing protein [Terrimonas ginsenosidimutans]MCG2613179.1 DUF4268 domain-containing protein [Terrimonas ginsenosidimutans]